MYIRSLIVDGQAVLLCNGRFAAANTCGQTHIHTYIDCDRITENNGCLGEPVSKLDSLELCISRLLQYRWFIAERRDKTTTARHACVSVTR